MTENIRKNVLELKIPPLLVVLATAGLIWLVARIAPGFGFEFPARNVFAIGFILAGIVISASGFYPATLTWNDEERQCADKEALENCLAELLRDPIIGEKLQTLINQK
jgi:hypothetical protein